MTTLFSDDALVRTFDEGPLALERPTPAQDASGGWGETVTAITLQPIAVHPHVDRLTLDRQEGADREVRKIRLYTLQELREGDRLTWRGEKYRVVTVDPRDSNAAAWEAVAERVEP